MFDLVGGIPTSLKYMKVSWDYYSQYMCDVFFNPKSSPFPREKRAGAPHLVFRTPSRSWLQGPRQPGAVLRQPGAEHTVQLPKNKW